MLAGFLNNVGAAFNLTVMGLVLVAISANSKVDPREQSIVSSAGMVGAVSGQLLMGVMGDCLGRVRALLLTTLIIMFGSFLSAFLPRGNDLFFTLAICRFVTGFGVGGVYPLTAVASAEEKGNKGDFSTLVVFSGQGWGQLLAPVTVYILASFKFNEADNWRITLAIAAFPCIAALVLIIKKMRQKTLEDALNAVDSIRLVAGEHPDNVEFQHEQDRLSALEHEQIIQQSNCVQTFFNRKNLRRLIGAGGTWFIFDVTFYSNVVFAPAVLENVFGLNRDASVKEKAGPTCLVILAGLPGYYLAIALVERYGLKKVQIFGFVMLAALYGLLSVTSTRLPPIFLFFLYAMTFFVSNLGPNSTTFCLPSRMFPKATRSTFNGICAALGKAGAVVGTAMFPIIFNGSGGLSAALGVSSLVALSGAIVTYYFVDVEFAPRGTRGARNSANSEPVEAVEMNIPLSGNSEVEPGPKRLTFSSHGIIPDNSPSRLFGKSVPGS